MSRNRNGRSIRWVMRQHTVGRPAGAAPRSGAEILKGEKCQQDTANGQCDEVKANKRN